MSVGGGDDFSALSPAPAQEFSSSLDHPAIRRAVELVLEQGCAVKLADVFAGAPFRELCAEQERIFRETGDRGVAARAGHLLLVKLFNTMPEEQALALASGEQAGSGFDPVARSLFFSIGRALRRAAGECLPKEARDIAVRWRAASPAEQIELAGELFQIFLSDSSKAKGDLNWRGVAESARSQALANQGSLDKILPLVYGPWRSSDNRANCQGKFQMLAAFADLAGTACLCSHPVVDANSHLTDWRIAVRERVARDIAERGLIPPDDFKESLEASKFDSARRQADRFHHMAPVLRLADGRWILIDPHCVTWGVLSERWGFDRIVNLLGKYEKALPGLCLQGMDAGMAPALEARFAAGTTEMLDRSQQLEKKLHGCTDLLQAAEILTSTGEGRFIINAMRSESEGGAPSDLPPEFVQIASVAVLCGSIFPEVGEIWRFSRDPEYRKTRLDSVLTTYHCIAANQVCNESTTFGKGLIHPVMGFSNAIYSMGVAAVNYAVVERGGHSPATARFFVENCADDVALHNLLHGPLGRFCHKVEWDLFERARQTTIALPHRHPLLNELLDDLNRVLV